MQNPVYRWRLPTPSQPYRDAVSKETRPRLPTSLSTAPIADSYTRPAPWFGERPGNILCMRAREVTEQQCQKKDFPISRPCSASVVSIGVLNLSLLVCRLRYMIPDCGAGPIELVAAWEKPVGVGPLFQGCVPIRGFFQSTIGWPDPTYER